MMKLQRGWYSKIKKSNLERKRKITEANNLSDQTDNDDEPDVYGQSIYNEYEDDDNSADGQKINPNTPASDVAKTEAAKVQSSNDSSSSSPNIPEPQQETQNPTEEKAQEKEQPQNDNSATVAKEANEWSQRVQQADNKAQNDNPDGVKFQINEPKTFGPYLKAYCDILFEALSKETGAGDAATKAANDLVKTETKTTAEENATGIDNGATDLANSDNDNNANSNNGGES